jgi:CoA:oxalate CoA-transferase
MNVLKGIRVLDLSQFLSGPRASQLLCLFGAEVIKVEPPAGDTMRLLLSMSGSERGMSTLHAGKKGTVIDLKNPGGREVFLRLVDASDVVVDNLKPGTMDGMGLSPSSLMERNGRLIYASISGFGKTGPLSGRTAFDIISQATGGIMYANGQEDRPPGVLFGDLVSGAYCAMGVLLALMERSATGRGRMVDISMQDVMYFHNFWGFLDRANGPARADLTRIFGREGRHLLSDREHPMPFWNSFKAKDGHVAVVALSDAQWNVFMEVIGRPELKDDPLLSNFVARVRNSDRACGIISEWMGERTCAEIIEALTKGRIPCGKVQSYDEINGDEQLAARGMHAQVRHARLGDIGIPGNPVRFAGEAEGTQAAGPDLGEHTAEVLTKILSMSETDIGKLMREGAIR